MSEDGEFTKLLREKATFALDVEKWEVDVALVLQKVDEAAKDFPATFKKNPHFEGQYLLQLDSDDVGKEITRLAKWFLKWFGTKREETPSTQNK
jgi:hypothetical protein